MLKTEVEMAHKLNPLDPSDTTNTTDPSFDPLLGSTDAPVLQSHGMVAAAGETVAQLTEDWWAWALQAPLNNNPLLGGDPTVNNTGPVFFVPGSLGGDVSLEFSVAAGTPLLVPVLNGIVIQNDGTGNPHTTDNKGAANQALTGWQTSTTDLFLDIDGHSVSNLHADLTRTDFFSIGFAQPGSLIEALADGIDISKEIAPCKSFGYWEVIQGLTPGDHTLGFGGTASFGSEAVHALIHVV
jgi:hypothetical protein